MLLSTKPFANAFNVALATHFSNMLFLWSSVFCVSGITYFSKKIFVPPYIFVFANLRLSVRLRYISGFSFIISLSNFLKFFTMWRPVMSMKKFVFFTIRDFSKFL